ncbi:MAG: hypothetical protein AAGG75_13080 [Bacteroidota bacterium]
MKKVFHLFTLALMGLLFTGCFEIVEDIKMNDNGSGLAKVTVNMSESKDDLANYMSMEKMNGVKIPSQEEIERNLERLRKAFAEQPGISDVKIRSDFENFIFNFDCNFSNLTSFNKAINKVISKMDRSLGAPPALVHFSQSGGQFKRHFDYPMPFKKYEDMTFMERFLLESARFVSIYRFDRPIGKHTNDAAQLSGSKKSIKLESKLADLVKGTITLRNDISF